MRTPLITVLAMLAAGTASAQSAGPMLRCESADGKVTYAGSACPPGTEPVRSVAPPGRILPDERKAAGERARKDSQQLNRIERDRNAEEVKTARADKADKVRAQAHARTCSKLALRVKQAKDDLTNIAQNRRSGAERKLKRAQELHELECGQQK